MQGINFPLSLEREGSPSPCHLPGGERVFQVLPLPSGRGQG